MKRRVKKLVQKRKERAKEVQVEEKPENSQAVPRITTETIVAHREKRLSSARKYIYPLEHSKNRVVIITLSIVLTVVIAFFVISALALYKLQTTSPFMYGVTKVVPFPIARKGSNFISYENYLFELRHYIHYYETQQKLDFNSEAGKQQLQEFKRRALDKVINDAYIKQLAKENGVSVTDEEVNEQISVLRNQNRLGSSDDVFEDVLKDYWGWSINDFKRSLRQQILAQKLAAQLDKSTSEKANKALEELKAGADFATIAKKYSDDNFTKDNGGEFPFLVDRTNRDLSAKTTESLYKLQPGKFSDVIVVDYTLEILKSIEVKNDKVKGAHVLFNLNDLTKHINDLKDRQKTRVYIDIPQQQQGNQQNTQ